MGNSMSCCGKCKGCRFFRKVWKPEEPNPDSVLPKPAIPPEEGKKPDLDAPDAGKVISVRNLDLCLAANGIEHRTDRFELMTRERQPSLVVRRGAPFVLDLTLSRPYNAEKDAVSFIFTVADTDKPNYGHGTLVAVPLLDKPPEVTGVWSAYIENQYENHLTIKILTAPSSVVAQWKIDIDTKLIGNGAVNYTHPLGFYLIFNPWCPQDDVYLEGEALREEYVLQDTGLIWRGSHNRLRPSIWKYSQFEKDILDCSLYLVTEVGKVRGNARGDAIKVSRAISAAINSPDDEGALMGNWSDDFGGGTPPTKWVGSMNILQQYYKKKKPVKYGQCWVFAGVLATVCRAIGLPCRVVTTYSSAHDTQGSLTVDYFVDQKGSVMEELNLDSIWNYHVWNEVWMKRPDLGDKYNGWQALDSTPQELSDSIFRCGPASVAAVKLGEIQKPYDNTFLYAEVNADKVFWRYAGPTQPLKLLQKDTTTIGKSISTKAVGLWEREDITDTYKYQEETKEERDAMMNALKMSESLFSRYYLNEDFNDILFDFALRDDIKIGEPFSVILIAKNRSKSKEHTINGNLRVDTVHYTGKVGQPVKLFAFNKIVKPLTTEEVRLDVTFDEYYSRLVEQCAFNIACLVTVVETEFEYFAQDDFRVRKPDIKISIQGTPTTGQEFTAIIKLQNPLPIPLKKSIFLLEGCGLEKQLQIKLDENIAPGAFATVSVKFLPPWSGRHTIAAKFVSKELNDVDGFLAFMVQPQASFMINRGNGSRVY